MFCKWCGNKIQFTDHRCPACGRDTPPMSDCGGLYNLKHFSGPELRPEVHVPPAQCPVVEKMEPKYARDRRTSKKRHITMVCCSVAILAAIVCTAVLVLSMGSRLKSIEEQIEGIPEALELVAAEIAPKETTEIPETTEQEIVASEVPSPYCFNLGVTVSSEDGTEIGTTCDFEDYAEEVRVTTSVSGNQSEKLIGVSFMLNETESIEIDLVREELKTSDIDIGVKCNFNLSIMDSRDVVYQWQYLTEDDEWADINAKQVTEQNDYYTVRCDNNLRGLVNDASSVKLRCVISVENESEDTVSVIVDGFVITQNTSVG